MISIVLPSGRVVHETPRATIEHAGQRFVDRLAMEQVLRPTPLSVAVAGMLGNPRAAAIPVAAVYVRRPIAWRDA